MVSESGIARRVPDRETAEVIGCARFGDVLPQELHAISKRVPSAQFGLGLLKQEVVAVVEPHGPVISVMLAVEDTPTAVNW